MIERKSLKTSYGNINYLDSGSKEPCLIYLHGAFGGQDPILNFAKYYGSDRFRFIAPALPGHSGSFGITKDFTYEDLTSSMVEFLNQLDIQGAILVGHSLGGRILLDVISKEVLGAKAIILLAPLLESPKDTFSKVAARVTKDFLLDGGIRQVKSIGEYGNKPKISQLESLKNIWKIVKHIESIGDIDSKPNPFIMWGVNDTALPIPRNLVDRIKTVGFKVYPGGHYWFLNNMYCFEDVENIL